MAPQDLVIHNGVQMRRDYAESLIAAQRLTHYSADGVLAPRIVYGFETYPMVTPEGDLCPCCQAARGQLHEPLCEREKCPICKLQVMSCDCAFFTYNAVIGDGIG